jgi:uncharacterized phage-associated protein
MITSEQFQEWKTHPVTQEIFAELTKAKNDLMTQLAIGNTVGNTAEATHGLTNKTVGQIDGLNQLLNISFSDTELSTTNNNDVGGY